MVERGRECVLRSMRGTRLDDATLERQGQAYRSGKVKRRLWSLLGSDD